MGTGYRPPSREPQGRWARHIHAKRREWGWSQTRGFEAVREGLGLSPKSRSAYIPIDEGKRLPTPQEEKVLLTVYGVPPEGEPEPAPASDLSELAASIRALAQAIQEERAERLEWERGVLESVSSLVRWLGQRDDHEPSPHAGDRGAVSRGARA